MAVLSSSNKRGVFSRSIFISMLLGSLLFAGVIIQQSTKLATGSEAQVIRVGNTVLLELYKVPADDGYYNAGVSFGSGLVWYILSLLIIGFIWGLIRYMRQQRELKISKYNPGEQKIRTFRSHF